MGYYDRSDHDVLWEGDTGPLKHCTSKAIDCLILSELFCRSLEYKNFKGNTEDGGLTGEVLEKCLKAICYFELRFHGHD